MTRGESFRSEIELKNEGKNKISINIRRQRKKDCYRKLNLRSIVDTRSIEESKERNIVENIRSEPEKGIRE